MAVSVQTVVARLRAQLKQNVDEANDGVELLKSTAKKTEEEVRKLQRDSRESQTIVSELVPDHWTPILENMSKCQTGIDSLRRSLFNINSQIKLKEEQIEQMSQLYEKEIHQMELTFGPKEEEIKQMRGLLASLK